MAARRLLTQQILNAYLLGSPKGGLSFLVHLPDIMVFDGKDNEAAGIVSQQRLILNAGVGRHFTLLVGEECQVNPQMPSEPGETARVSTDRYFFNDWPPAACYCYHGPTQAGHSKETLWRERRVKLSQLGQCRFGAIGGRPLLAASATHLSPTRATHQLGVVLEDFPRSLAGQDAGAAEGRGL